MPDWAISMGHSKAGFNHLAGDLIKQTQFYGICGIAPDCKVGSTSCDGRAKGAGICWKHGDILPLNAKICGFKRLFLR
jgi:hypothetical protein